MRRLTLIMLLCLIGFTILGRAATAPVSSAILPPPEPVVVAPEPIVVPSEPVVTNANSLGRFPVLMYHRIADDEAEWVRSRDNFRKDLAELYARGYTLVNLSDFLSGRAVVPAGRTPAVLTFDDSTQGQFNYLVGADKTVQVDPDSAVGMILEACARWPELGIGGTFYINANPFGQRGYAEAKLRHLVELGFEIGNHTWTHPYLKNLTGEQVQEELARIQQYVADAVPGYRLASVALPFGVAPRERHLAAAGVWNGAKYSHAFILEVGAEPAYPPGHDKYNPLSIPRIKVTDELFYRWLDWLDADPARRFVSKGPALAQ